MITVMTLNLRLDVESDGENAWPHRVDAVADTISHSGAEIVGTQEGLPHMLAELDQRLPDYSRIGEPRRDGDESCAIWYRHELMNVVEWGQFWLSETPDIRESVSWGSSFPRICTWALFCWSKQPTRRIRVYNTHLDHVSREARQNGAD